MIALHHVLSDCTCPACDVQRLRLLDTLEERLRCWGGRTALTLRDLAKQRERTEARLRQRCR